MTQPPFVRSARLSRDGLSRAYLARACLMLPALCCAAPPCRADPSQAAPPQITPPQITPPQTAPLLAAPALPDTFVARLAALASMETLNAELLASHSATLTLEAWCASHALAEVARVVAVRVPGAANPASAEQRRRLEVGPDETLAYRRVRLTCGDRVLSEAENWYVPSRLTPSMNAALEATDTPFGKVVAPLGTLRQTFAAAVLWPVLPPGWERRAPPPDGAGVLDVPPILFEHRAVLYDAGHRPFSEVDERYTRDTLAFGRTTSPAEAR